MSKLNLILITTILYFLIVGTRGRFWQRGLQRGGQHHAH